MATRIYDYTVTIDNITGTFAKGNVIAGPNGTEALIVDVVNVGSRVNAKIKINNAQHNFVVNDKVFSNAIINTPGSSGVAISNVLIAFGNYKDPTPATSIVTTANGTIVSRYASNYIREKNTFQQNPIVRLYTVYYPGTWYPPNDNGNPTGEGDGRAWPHLFPLRFAEVQSDLNSDLDYKVYFGNTDYTPIPISSGKISVQSTGEINDVNISIANHDNIITDLVENPNLVGKSSNSVFGTVNGEIVSGLDPRTVPQSSVFTEQEHLDAITIARNQGNNYDEDIVNLYGKANSSITVDATNDINGTWKNTSLDSRDLLGGVVEIKSTYANFLDFWPEYSTVTTVVRGSNVEVKSSLPYRIGDKVKVFSK